LIDRGSPPLWCSVMSRTFFGLSIWGVCLLLAPAVLRAQNPSIQSDPAQQSEPAQNEPNNAKGRQTENGSTPGRFVKRTLGPAGWIMAGAGAGVTQGTNTPSEWGQGATGYGRRFASSFGKHIVSNIIRYPIAHFRHEELTYRPSGKHGFGPRIKYALLSVFITHKTTTGAKTVYTSQLAGALGSGLISRLWQPASTRTLALGFSSAGTSLAVEMGIHALREFWPDIRHFHRRNALSSQTTGATSPLEPPSFRLDAPLTFTPSLSSSEQDATAEAALCER